MQEESDNLSTLLSRMPDIAERFEVGKLSLFISELLRWNDRIGLVSKRNTGEVISQMIKRSVGIWDFLVNEESSLKDKESLRVVDIGSGGGFPGVIWKILMPKLDMTLVERKANKAFFLENVAVSLGLERVWVIDKDVRDIARDCNHREAYDIATMLAVAPPDRIAKNIEKLLKPGGFFVTLRSGREKVFQSILGNSLRIHSAASGQEGAFLLYEKNDS